MTRISFPTHNPVVLRDMRSEEVRRSTIDCTGHLFMPPGPASRRPAVVVMEGLGGLKEERELAYGPRLAGRGYVTLVVDTFETRNAPQDHTLRALLVTESMMLADAYAALRFLAAHPAVDPGNIYIMGFSYGGMISILSAYEQIRRIFVADARRFAGHVSYYGCSVPRFEDPTTTGAPVKIMLGELDRNVSVDRTRDIVGDLRRGGSAVDLTVFEDTYHQWDGGDVEKRFVRFSLERVRMFVDRNDRIRDEATGLTISDRFRRALALGRRVSWKGYHILRDEEVMRRSDEMLFAFLERHSGVGRHDGAEPRRMAG